jgi:hypothetical protein
MFRYASKLKPYEQWLHEEGYQPSTVEVTLRHLNTVYARPTRDVETYRIPHVRRYLRFVALTHKNPLGAVFIARMKKQGIEASNKIHKQGKRTKKNLTKTQWDRLRAELREGDITSKLLLAYMLSPYRISDFLDMEVKLVDEQDIQDAVSRKWLRRSPPKKKLYQLLCPTKRCAYSRLRKKLQALCEELRMQTDLDTLYKTFHALEDAA